MARHRPMCARSRGSTPMPGVRRTGACCRRSSWHRCRSSSGSRCGARRSRAAGPSCSSRGRAAGRRSGRLGRVRCVPRRRRAGGAGRVVGCLRGAGPLVAGHRPRIVAAGQPTDAPAGLHRLQPVGAGRQPARHRLLSRARLHGRRCAAAGDRAGRPASPRAAPALPPRRRSAASPHRIGIARAARCPHGALGYTAPRQERALALPAGAAEGAGRETATSLPNAQAKGLASVPATGRSSLERGRPGRLPTERASTAAIYTCSANHEQMWLRHFAHTPAGGGRQGRPGGALR